MLGDLRALLAPQGLLIFSSHNLAAWERHRPTAAAGRKARAVRLARTLAKVNAGALARRAQHAPRVWFNRRRLGPLQYREHDHAIVNDAAHEYSLLSNTAMSSFGVLLVEAVAAVDDRRQHLLRLGRRQHEDVFGGGSSSVLRNAFHACRREHVRLVEDVDLLAPGDRRVGHRLAQVADVVDRVVGGRVHLDDVERGRAGRSRRTSRSARTARSSARRSQFRQAARIFAIEVLPVPREPDEEVGVVDLVLRDGVASACARRAPGRRPRRRSAGDGGGRARGW